MRSVLAPFLNIGFNLAILHSSGNVDDFINKFIIFLKGRVNTSAPFLKNVPGIWSIPVALLLSRLSKTFLITSSDAFDNSVLGVVVFGCLTSKFVGCLWQILLEASSQSRVEPFESICVFQCFELNCTIFLNKNF